MAAQLFRALGDCSLEVHGVLESMHHHLFELEPFSHCSEERDPSVDLGSSSGGPDVSFVHEVGHPLERRRKSVNVRSHDISTCESVMPVQLNLTTHRWASITF